MSLCGRRLNLAFCTAPLSCSVMDKICLNQNGNLSCISVPPYIERDGIDIFPEVVENRTVILSCPASGLPTPTVRWLRNGEVLPPQLPPSGRLEVLAGGRQLRITSSSLTDAGTYTCEASNKAGKDNQDFRLSIHSKLVCLLK